MLTMKTTVELPQDLFTQTREYARARGKTFREVLVEALTQLVLNSKGQVSKPGWEELFGAFEHEREETRRIQELIDEEFSKVDVEDWT
jgi:hypothetical protein